MRIKIIQTEPFIVGQCSDDEGRLSKVMIIESEFNGDIKTLTQGSIVCAASVDVDSIARQVTK